MAIQIILSLVIFVNILLSVFVIAQDRKSWNNILFSLLSFFAAIWTFTNLMTGIFSTPFWLESTYATGALVIAMGAIWTFFITDHRLDKRKIFLVFTLAITLFFASFVEGFIAKDFEDIYIGGVFTGTPGVGLFLYTLFFLITALTICHRLFIAQKREILREKKLQLKYVLYGAIATLSISALTSFIFPIFSIFQFAGLDSLGFLIFLAFVAYAIVKHHLLNIKVIATEIFVFVIWIFFLVRIFLVDALQEKLTAAGLLALLIVFGILLIKSVITEVKNRERIELLNQQLQKSLEQLRKIDELKTEFVSLASHQLRTPLTPIKGYADMLRKGDFGGPLGKPEQQQAVDNIYLSAQRMVELIDDLLDISKLEKEGGFTYNFQIGNPEVVVKKIVEEMQTQAKVKGLSLSFESTLSGEVKIKFDPLKFTDAVGNVINNALKYTKEGSVGVKLSEDDGHVLIFVKDTGVGISAEDIEKLFQKFFRGKEIARLATEGTGLGLYFTRRVIEDHGGRISVQSEGVGKGSEFTITIPKATGETPLQSPQAQSQPEPQPAPQNPADDVPKPSSPPEPPQPPANS